MDFFETLDKLNASFGPSGMEDDICQTIRNIAEPYVDEVYTDVLGNLICHKKGPGKKLMFAAHMDSIGFIVRHIEDNGTLRVTMVGYVYAAESVGVPVRFRGGERGVVYTDNRDKEKNSSFNQLYIDIGATSREEAEKYVQIGDMAVYDTKAYFTATGALVTPYADNHCGCVLLLETMERLSSSPNDIYFVFTVQEEVGLRGAITASYQINADIGIAIDVTYCGDTTTSGTGQFNRGAAIKVMDSRVICTPSVVNQLKKVADENQIPYVLDVLPGGCTDAGTMVLSREGMKVGGISFPCKAPHCAEEMVSLTDIENCIALCVRFAEQVL